MDRKTNLLDRLYPEIQQLRGGEFETIRTLIHAEIKRSVWVRPIFSVEQWFRQGDSDHLIVVLRTTDPALHFNFLRMDANIFEDLFSIVDPGIEKQSCVREPISAHTRLQICLRCLASGDSMKSIGYAFRVASNTVSQIVHEVCSEICDKLKDIVLSLLSKDEWIKIAKNFEKIWNFPYCLGIDGRHIVIEAPPHSSFVYYNYKKDHSFNLTAVADANYRFILVDVGAEGHRSDAEVFANSAIKSRLEANTLNVSEPSAVGLYKLPFVLLSDDTYPLALYLMRSYARSSQLDLRKNNYRHRARRVVESAFGILATRWQIFRRSINTYVLKAEKMVLATICLHNYIISKKLEKHPQERRYLMYNDNDKQPTSLGMRNLSDNMNNLISNNLSNEYR